MTARRPETGTRLTTTSVRTSWLECRRTRNGAAAGQSRLNGGKQQRRRSAETEWGGAATGTTAALLSVDLVSGRRGIEQFGGCACRVPGRCRRREAAVAAAAAAAATEAATADPVRRDVTRIPDTRSLFNGGNTSLQFSVITEDASQVEASQPGLVLTNQSH